MENSKIKVGLVIPVLNNFDQAIDLIYSAKTINCELKIYIQPQHKYQLPLSQAWNNGIKQAVTDGCSYIIISNDDVLLAPWTIDAWVDKMSKVPENIVLTAPLDTTETFSDPFEICFTDESTEYKYNEKELFSCFMIKEDFWKQCGWFDENFDPCWWEDNDMHYRIKLLGFDIEKFEVPYIHLGSQTTKKLTIPLNSIKSSEYYLRKWGSRNRNLTESYKTPYNDKNLTPKDWIK
jgi:GT2 family glycosyltransferase